LPQQPTDADQADLQRQTTVPLTPAGLAEWLRGMPEKYADEHNGITSGCSNDRERTHVQGRF